MGEKNTTDELLIHIAYIREGVDGINERLDNLNGRTRKNETDIAVLKDRQSDSRQAGVSAGRNWGAGAGTAGGFLGGVVAGFFQKWMTGQ